MTPHLPELVIAFLVGLVVGSWFHLPHIGLVVCVSLLLLLIAWGRRSRNWCDGLGRIAFVVLGALHSQRILLTPASDDHLIHRVGEDPVDVEGILIQAPELRPDRSRLTVRAVRIYRGGTPRRPTDLPSSLWGKAGSVSSTGSDPCALQAAGP